MSVLYGNAISLNELLEIKKATHKEVAFFVNKQKRNKLKNQRFNKPIEITLYPMTKT